MCVVCYAAVMGSGVALKWLRPTGVNMGGLYGYDLHRGGGTSRCVGSGAALAGAPIARVDSVLTGTVSTLRLRSGSSSEMSSLQQDQQRVNSFLAHVHMPI